MEYIAGRNLDTIMVKDKANVITGLNNILTVLKRNKIVHGDLLPHNFIITTDDDDDYCVRVVDFDWAGEESKCTYPSSSIWDYNGLLEFKLDRRLHISMICI